MQMPRKKCGKGATSGIPPSEAAILIVSKKREEYTRGGKLTDVNKW